MKFSSAAFGFLFVLCSTLIVYADDDCLGEDSSVDLEFDQPNLGEQGDPVGAVWASGTGNPFANEIDEESSWDQLGNAEFDQSTGKARVNILNRGGNLSGPNGLNQNGPQGDESDEGDEDASDGTTEDIEVVVGWKYFYPVQMHRATVVEPGGVGGGWGTTITIWMMGYKYSRPPQTVKPC